MQANVGGVQRWGIIESETFRYATDAGVDVEWVANSSRSAYHVELRAGPFLATVSKADERGKLPPEADFRETMIEAGQLRLFQEGRPVGKHVFALIVHGRNADEASPAFIDVLFPDRDGQLAEERIDLLALSRDSDRESRLVAPASQEQIPDRVMPTIRRPAETGTAE